MFNGRPPNSIKVYWLSEFADKFEIWMAKRASIVSSPDSLSFSLYLVWPVEEAEEGRMEIKQKGEGLVFYTNWFPEEEFALEIFTSPDQERLVLLCHYERETIFFHLTH
ncbi:MAG: hypothetical protein AB1491_14655 [Thermodesulfobacteriota bacterium]